MSKRLSKTEDVAQAWANQTRNGGRAASASFAGPRLISYSTCVALLTEPFGQRVALISRNHYSNSTAVVIGRARTACALADIPVFGVVMVAIEGTAHAENLAGYERMISQTLERVDRAKKPEIYRAEAFDLIDEATRYSDTFALSWSYQGVSPETVLSKAEREAGA